MKTFKLFLVIFLITFTTASAQLSVPAVTGDSTSALKAIYVGMLYSGAHPTDSWNPTHTANIQIGAEIDYGFSETSSLYANASYSSSGGPIVLFYPKQQLFNGDVEVIAGMVPRTVTLQRNIPTSFWGQFEFPTKANIPGVTSGALVTLKSVEDMEFCVGAYRAPMSNRREIGVGLSHGDDDFSVQLAGYGDFENVYGTAATMKNSEVSCTFFYSDMKMYRVYLEHYAPFATPYIDLAYGHDTEKVEGFEAGFYKEFSSGFLGSLVGLGYQYPTRAITMYCSVHL
jgi:hypothetical protein